MKTSELTDIALDRAVAKCMGEPLSSPYPYSTNWAFGGPIIEREQIGVVATEGSRASPVWASELWSEDTASVQTFFGPTPLIAAMRCYVASKLGDEVDIPKELV